MKSILNNKRNKGMSIIHDWNPFVNTYFQFFSNFLNFFLVLPKKWQLSFKNLQYAYLCRVNIVRVFFLLIIYRGETELLGQTKNERWVPKKCKNDIIWLFFWQFCKMEASFWFKTKYILCFFSYPVTFIPFYTYFFGK